MANEWVHQAALDLVLAALPRGVEAETESDQRVKQVAAAVALLDDAVSETQDAAQAIATLLMAALAMADEWRTVDPDADVVGLVEALRDEAFEDDSGMFG